MIASHQPTIFGTEVIAAMSSVKNGTMKFGSGQDEMVLQNRTAFLREAGIAIADTTLVSITYATDDFAKYRVVGTKDKGRGMQPGDAFEPADALVVDRPNHALFLPLADCVGVILYDATHHALMVSHVGRHSAEIEGAIKSVQYLQSCYNTDPRELKVWLSPGVGNATYPLHAFNGRSLHDVITTQLLDVGVQGYSIENGNIDTAGSEQYYSHSEFLKGNKQSGRFAIVAMMREQGEPAS
jgi:copper oxidase (laccase) domain-containing protein